MTRDVKNLYLAVFFTCLLLTTPNLSSQVRGSAAFAGHLDALANVIHSRHDITVARTQAEFSKSLHLSGPQNFVQLASVQTTNSNTAQIGAALGDVIDDIVTGTTAVYAGAGLARIDVSIDQQQSVWQSNRIRNGFDRAKPVFDVVGEALVGASLVLTSNTSGKNGIGTSKGATGLLGVTSLALGSVLQHFFGSQQSQLDKTAGKINGVSADIAQVEFSRAAYDDMQNRWAMADKAYQDAKSQIGNLADLRDRARQIRDNPANVTNDQLKDLIDQVEGAREKYQSISEFVDSYTAQLSDLYSRYAQSYPALKDQLSTKATSISDFQRDFDQNVKGKLLVNFPKYQGLLVELRSELGQTP